MKKLISLVFVFFVFVGIGISSFAMVALSKEDYLAAYNDYKNFYNNSYVSAYNEYNDSLTVLAASISEANITTIEQVNSIKAFVNHLKQTKADFFGDRTTVGKSRYDVPFLRDSMFYAAKNGDYGLAINYCSQLKIAVEQRINFLNTIKNEVVRFTEKDIQNLILEEGCKTLYNYVLSNYQNFDNNHLFKKSDDTGKGDPKLQTYLSRYIETSMEQAGYGRNILNLKNPYSNKEGFLNWDTYKLTDKYTNQAVIMSNHNDLKYSNSLSLSNGVKYLKGSIVMYLSNGYDKIEIYFIDMDGKKSTSYFSINVR